MYIDGKQIYDIRPLISLILRQQLVRILHDDHLRQAKMLLRLVSSLGGE
ncbi:hypothetical protein GGQ77_001662 [Geobacillus thermodenitrificans]|nr:hypothetical protein [Geobacillus thermodenitrificans]